MAVRYRVRRQKLTDWFPNLQNIMIEVGGVDKAERDDAVAKYLIWVEWWTVELVTE